MCYFKDRRRSHRIVDEVVASLSRLTGLEEEYLRQSNLRVPMSNFGKELMREEGRTIGRFDSRYKGIDRDRVGESAEYDPSGLGDFRTIYIHDESVPS